MKKKTVKPDRICFECLHYEACQSWNIGSLVETAADNCVNYRASVNRGKEDLSRKETPMKITEIHVDEYYCPACGAENNCDQGCVQDAYCPACGQRLLPEPLKEE